jgi:hypothetical protein
MSGVAAVDVRESAVRYRVVVWQGVHGEVAQQLAASAMLCGIISQGCGKTS